jgi:uncharacterized protein
MEKRSQYTIQFASLTTGLHQYEFHISDKFFQLFEHSLIHKADINVEVALEKGVNNLQFTFTFNGKVHLTCVRCLDEFDMQVSNEVRHLVVRQLDAVEETVEEEEDIIAIPGSVHEIDLAAHLYDYLNLMVPFNPVHPDKEDGSPGCNEKALEDMNNHLGHDPQNDDPRWDMLKRLKLK